MRNVEVKLIDAAVKQFLRSNILGKDLERRAAAIAAAAGEGVEHEVYQGQDRIRARVWTETFEAKRRQAESGTLTRAMDAGRK